MALQCLRLLEKTFVTAISRTNQGVLSGRSHLRSFPNQAAMPKVAPVQEIMADYVRVDNPEKNEIINNVNEQVKEGNHGRLFAVVQLCGKQFKVTPEDLIIIEGYWDPQAGDKIKMEKVLLVGSSDFTLVGRPILPSSLVYVEGTVIEKSLSSIRTHFRKIPRKQYQRINCMESLRSILQDSREHSSNVPEETRKIFAGSDAQTQAGRLRDKRGSAGPIGQSTEVHRPL